MELINGYFKNIICWAATGLTDLGFLRIVQKFKIVGRETNNNKGNTARELKSGKISLTDAFKRQVRKDIEIIKAQGDLVDKVEWHALNDIDNDALKFIRDEMTLKGVSANDFKVVVY
jgi:hypothetical protein